MSTTELGRAEVRGSVVHAAGEFDRGNVDVLRAALSEAVQGGEGLVVDLSEVTFMDSGAVSALFDYVAHHPRLRVRVDTVPARLLSILGFHELGLLDVVD